MRIYSMTATFGKLSQQTLTLEPGLNIIEAPNEWGKSTWCAFLMAMLYGIDTGSRSKAGFLADKEHYAPWSGEPMSGRMDICWNGRDITIERRNKGRTPMGEVKAFETATGLPVPELSVSQCGEVLLGVERSVFARAGFLKQSEMPVTEDESLRRRLNALVSTADESGTSDDLAQKLRDLKNRCRFHKSGLLPELEAQQQELDKKLQQLQSLQFQCDRIMQRQETLKEQLRLLENHKTALQYQENQLHREKLAAAQLAWETAGKELKQAQQDCSGLPSEAELREQQTRLLQLREVRDSLHMHAQMLPPLPENPDAHEAFRGADPHKAAQTATLDKKVLCQLETDHKKPIPYVVGGVLVTLGVVLLVLASNLAMQIGAGALFFVGIAALAAGYRKQIGLKNQIEQLKGKYRGLHPDQWEEMAVAYSQTRLHYEQQLQARQQELAELNRQMDENSRMIAQITGGVSLPQFEQTCREMQQKHIRLQELQRRYRQAEDLYQGLSSVQIPMERPEFEDVLPYSSQETAKRLTDVQLEQRTLHQQLGQCQGQMELLGQPETMETEKGRLQSRIATLERHYRALSIAQQTLQMATQELQRRFAPRISQRAQDLFSRLTGQRYQRLSLGQDLQMESGAQGENTMRGTLWRSDGTVDQLYLALRLAVAEELTPQAPLILDDALVRFDDVRLAQAMDILKEEAMSRQVILFTCQGREKMV